MVIEGRVINPKMVIEVEQTPRMVKEYKEKQTPEDRSMYQPWQVIGLV